MGELVDALDRITVSVVSPTQLVRLRMTRQSTKVTLAAGALRRLSGPQLAEETKDAWGRAIEGLAAGDRAVRDRLGRSRVKSLGWRRREAAMSKVEAAASSPRGHVALHRRGLAEIEIRVAPRATRHLDETALAAEINAGFAAVESKHRAARLDVVQRLAMDVAGLTKGADHV